MNNANKLQYLIELLDDDSLEVRNEILKELNSYGIYLEQDIESFSDILNEERLQLLQPVLNSNRRNWLTENWNEWFYLDDEIEKIEKALSLISAFHYGISNIYEFSNMVDELSEEFLLKIPYGDELDLAHFLFQEKAIKGAKENYYNPFHSNPVYSIKEKKGLPITLAIIYILVGNRLGFEIHGCNFPGHFLAKFEIDDETILVDCFNGGRFYYEKDLQNALNDSNKNGFSIAGSEANAKSIIRRVLKNLSTAYTFINDTENQKLFKELANQIPV
jgi:regulator of sirC expression with transglutaminase-like and TPR domain